MKVLSVFLVLAAARWAQAASMSDYRIRGYIEYRGFVGGSACNDTWLTACAQMGRLIVRAAPDSLKVGPPPTGFAILKNNIIDCPEGVAAITANADGGNQQASGTFPRDKVTPDLVPETAFVVSPGGGEANSIQINLLGDNLCIYQFQLMQATSFILGVQPAQWISILGAASSRAISPLLLLASSLLAVMLVTALR